MIYLILVCIIVALYWFYLKAQTEATHYKTLYHQLRLARFKDE